MEEKDLKGYQTLAEDSGEGNVVFGINGLKNDGTFIIDIGHETIDFPSEEEAKAFRKKFFEKE